MTIKDINGFFFKSISNNTRERDDNPIVRVKHYMYRNKMLTSEQEKAIDEENMKTVLECVGRTEKVKYCKPTEMFEDILDKPSAILERQAKEMMQHVKSKKDHYPLELYEK